MDKTDKNIEKIENISNRIADIDELYDEDLSNYERVKAAAYIAACAILYPNITKEIELQIIKHCILYQKQEEIYMQIKQLTELITKIKL